MPDDDLIDLMHPPKAEESSEGDSNSDPERRTSGEAFLIAIVLIVAMGILHSVLKGRSGAVQVMAMVVYTLAIPYIGSNRFLGPVPWDLLMRRKFLLGHCLALVLAYVITTAALAAEPHLPGWFITSGRKGSLFDICLMGIFLVPAFYESSLATRNKKEA